jgi:exodeoxyribonuclease-3
MSLYLPSGTKVQDWVISSCSWMISKLHYGFKERDSNLVICGDYNICHEAIDIHNPVQSKKVSGFLPEERAWFDGFLNSGFIDSFVFLNKEPDNYTWWTVRVPTARPSNKGWRIDYCLVRRP